MTREEFIRKAEKHYRSVHKLPPGTWGTYKKIFSDKGQVTFSKHNDKWILRRRLAVPGDRAVFGGVSSRYYVRSSAIQALTRLV